MCVLLDIWKISGEAAVECIPMYSIHFADLADVLIVLYTPDPNE